MTEHHPAKLIDDHWYLPVEDFHEVREIAEGAIELMVANDWTPEQLNALQDAYAKATGTRRWIARGTS